MKVSTKVLSIAVPLGLLFALFPFSLNAQLNGVGQDYKAKYPQEYAFFETTFDKNNGNNLVPERNSSFTIVAQKVEALQKSGAKISLGGMFSLLISESRARIAHYNTLCSQNSYHNSNNCWDLPESRYSYQLGLGAVHTSNFHPCNDRAWTGPQRNKFTQLAGQVGFSPTPEQVASVAAEIHSFCPASTQPQAVDYYILRAHDLGLPKDNVGNTLPLAGKYPFFTPSVSLAFFFSGLEAQPLQLTSDEQAICIWGAKNKKFYCDPQNQATILLLWKHFQTNPPAAQGTTYGQTAWSEIRPGQSSGDFIYRGDGAIVYRGKMLYSWPLNAKDPAWQPSIRFAPPEPLTNQIAVLRWDSDSGGVGGWILDRISGRTTVAEVAPKGWRILQWVSWSPDGRFALFVASGEITMGDMVLIELKTGMLRQIHYRDFTKDHGKTQLQIGEFEKLEWLSPNRYRIPITVRCNIYEVKGCDPSRVLSSQIAVVDVPSLTINY
jgi:hypothetical protein